MSKKPIRMSNLFLIFLSAADSGIRFLATFIYQTNADQQKVSVLYEFLVLSNLLCIPFLVMIPVTYRFAHFGKVKSTISNIYFNLLFFLIIIYCLLFIFLKSSFSSILDYAIFHGFFLALMGTLSSILNIKGKLQYLQTIKLVLGCCTAIILIISLSLNLSSNYIFELLIISISIFCAITIAKINFKTVTILRIGVLSKWLKLAIYKYRGATLNTIVLLVYTNIDRLIVVNVANDAFINQYAVSTTISAPILIISNVLQLRYWPNFAKKRSSSIYRVQLKALTIVSFGLAIFCMCVYLTLISINLFPGRLPPLASYSLVILYYSMYPIIQFNLFYSGLMRPSVVKSLALLFFAIISYWATRNVSQLHFTLPLLALTFAVLPVLRLKSYLAK